MRASLFAADLRQRAGKPVRFAPTFFPSDGHNPKPKWVDVMTQSTNRVLDELAKLMTDAAGATQGIKREIDTVVRNQAERILGDMNVVSRDEFDAVKAMAEKGRAENEALLQRIAALEAQLGSNTK